MSFISFFVFFNHLSHLSLFGGTITTPQLHFKEYPLWHMACYKRYFIFVSKEPYVLSDVDFSERAVSPCESQGIRAS